MKWNKNKQQIVKSEKKLNKHLEREREKEREREERERERERIWLNPKNGRKMNNKQNGWK